MRHDYCSSSFRGEIRSMKNLKQTIGGAILSTAFVLGIFAASSLVAQAQYDRDDQNRQYGDRDRRTQDRDRDGDRDRRDYRNDRDRRDRDNSRYNRDRNYDRYRNNDVY